MPPRSDEPLRRVTLNLGEVDCKIMEDRYGHGWTTVIRDLVRQHCQLERRKPKYARTLGDLADD
jgi:hypothetical protein